MSTRAKAELAWAEWRKTDVACVRAKERVERTHDALETATSEHRQAVTDSVTLDKNRAVQLQHAQRLETEARCERPPAPKTELPLSSAGDKPVTVGLAGAPAAKCECGHAAHGKKQCTVQVDMMDVCGCMGPGMRAPFLAGTMVQENVDEERRYGPNS